MGANASSVSLVISTVFNEDASTHNLSLELQIDAFGPESSYSISSIVGSQGDLKWSDCKKLKYAYLISNCMSYPANSIDAKVYVLHMMWFKS